MSSYQIPGAYVIGTGSRQAAIPGAYWIDTTVVTAATKRALYLSGGQLCEVTNALAGTGLKPIVMMSDGTIKERATTEGTPLVLDAGVVRCILAVEVLII